MLVAGDLGGTKTLLGLFDEPASAYDWVHNVALVWLATGIGALLFRTVHLFFIKGGQSGLVWMTKILTDPFHDIKLYYQAPLYLLRGELIDPGLPDRNDGNLGACERAVGEHQQHDDQRGGAAP